MVSIVNAVTTLMVYHLDNSCLVCGIGMCNVTSQLMGAVWTFNSYINFVFYSVVKVWWNPVNISQFSPIYQSFICICLQVVRISVTNDSVVWKQIAYIYLFM